jgi:hypothetical protein
MTEEIVQLPTGMYAAKRSDGSYIMEPPVYHTIGTGREEVKQRELYYPAVPKVWSDYGRAKKYLASVKARRKRK